MAATKPDTRVLTKKSVLTNPELYHTPGYCGFCPQFKFQIGETFGRTTTRLLADPNVPKSDRTVLANIEPVKPGYPARNTPAGNASYVNLKDRKASFGDQKFTEQMVPGYTGYIPKSQHYFGNRYAEICRQAVSTFEREQQGERKKKDFMKTLQRIQTGQIGPSAAAPWCPLKKLPGQERGWFNYSTMKEHSLSPYYMKDNDPQKSFMSGYTGFVPNARSLIGKGYPLITNRAIVAFTNNPKHPMTSAGKGAPGSSKAALKMAPLPPLQMRVCDETVKQYLCRRMPVIYPIESGLVPHYTGHIPGQKFRYGTTFGHSTMNVKRMPNCKNSKKKNGSS